MKAIKFNRFVMMLLMTFIATSCAIFQGNKKPVALELRYNKAAFINYGYAVELNSILIYSNGKEKDVTNKDELKVTVQGAFYSNGIFRIDNYPKKLSTNLIRVSASYIKDEVNLSASLEIPFNYKGDVQLNFAGKSGSTGEKGSKGTTPLLFRDGNAGGDGTIGGDGFAGDNLTVYVWKDSVDFYFIKVNNLTSSQNYIYKIKNEGYGFKFNVNGGSGGTGGAGGDGGDGKDGSNNNNKLKAPGNGGQGGIGGTGGNGGPGGSVYIFVHPNASDIQSKFAVYNFGGSGGYGGNGGDGGKAGKPLEGQTAANAGAKGNNGSGGYSGANGDVFQIIVEPFDIEY
ncbi:MAG: hypothetical protein IPO32_14110 [Crocinitomicaceae bacterium]|nr:hypothetical protein [Crocinitomicaceae bacterium]